MDYYLGGPAARYGALSNSADCGQAGSVHHTARTARLPPARMTLNLRWAHGIVQGVKWGQPAIHLTMRGSGPLRRTVAAAAAAGSCCEPGTLHGSRYTQ